MSDVHGDFVIDETPDAPRPDDAPDDDFEDRTGWLIGFGGAQILIGLGAFCLVPFTIFSVIMTNRLAPNVPQQNVWQQAAGAGIYLLLAAFFIWTGIGAIRCRRWVPPVMLSASGIALVAGLLSLVILPVMMWNIFDAPPPGTTPGARAPAKELRIAIIVFSIGIGFIVYVLVPGVFFIFYRWRDVRRTCETNDPVERWTDRCPTPALAPALLFMMGGSTAILFGPIYGFTPLFGVIITGLPAAAINVAIGAIFAALGYFVYRLSPIAWAAAMVLSLAGGASTAVTFMTRSFAEIYGALGMPPEQIEWLEKTSGGMPRVMGALGMLGPVILVIYLIAIRRYFLDPAAAAPAKTSPAVEETGEVFE